MGNAMDAILAEIDKRTADKMRAAVELCSIPCPKCGVGRGRFCAPGGKVHAERVMPKGW